MKRYTQKFNFELKTVSIKEKFPKQVNTVVDKSSYRPTIDDVRLFSDGGSAGRTPIYDFPDGKDTGLRLTQLRDNSADVTELENTKLLLKEVADNQKNLANKIVEEEVRKATEKVTKNKETVNTTSSSNASTSSV